MDLLKNLLFTHVKTDEFTKLKDEWKKITKPLEKEKEKPLRFLRYFLMANYKIEMVRAEKVDAVVREDEIYDWFVRKENAALCDYANKPFEFVRKITRNVELYLGFAEGRGNDGKANVPMGNLKKLCGGAFSLHFVLLLAASGLAKPLFDHFVSQLESFLFYYIFTKTPTKDLERSFSAWADELRAIAETPIPEAQQKKLNAFVAERFQKNMSGKEAELSDSLKRYSLTSMQHYRTRYRLLLVADQEEPLTLSSGRFCLRRDLVDCGEIFAAKAAFRDFFISRGKGRISKRVAYFAPKAGVTPAALDVRDLNLRWASCSSKGKLAFHWKCMMAPPKIIDYIIVHELCHFHHFDHSDAFWNEVDKIMPDYAERKEWLKKNGAGLDL